MWNWAQYQNRAHWFWKAESPTIRTKSRVTAQHACTGIRARHWNRTRRWGCIRRRGRGRCGRKCNNNGLLKSIRFSGGYGPRPGEPWSFRHRNQIHKVREEIEPTTGPNYQGWTRNRNRSRKRPGTHGCRNSDRYRNCNRTRKYSRSWNGLRFQFRFGPHPGKS